MMHQRGSFQGNRDSRSTNHPVVEKKTASISLDFYADPVTRTLKPELFYQVAQEYARLVFEAGQSDRGRLDRNKRTQLRKFYDEVVRLNELAKPAPDSNTPEKNWGNILPYVNMLIAKSAYAQGRKLVTREFTEDFMKKAVEQVKEPDDLRVFASLFEAFMGFYKVLDPK